MPSALREKRKKKKVRVKDVGKRMKVGRQKRVGSSGVHTSTFSKRIEKTIKKFFS